MKNWEEVKTAYQVALLGTVSAAAEALSLHRTTVMRHIDSLEAELGQKLFIRHTSGYIPTEAGEEILQVVKVTDDQFKKLASRIKGHSNSLRGELIVTSIDVFSPLLVPALSEFRQKHPQVKLRYLATTSILRLEYGEAHIALRVGPKCETPDNLVQSFGKAEFGLFASKSYIEREGMPQSQDDLVRHSFVAYEERGRSPLEKWIAANIPDDRIALRASNPFVLDSSIASGIGIGFMPIHLQNHYFPKLVEVLPRQEEWHTLLWLVTHADIHQTEKVQAFLQILKTCGRLGTS